MADVILPELPPDEEYVVRKKPKTELQLLREQRDIIQADLGKFIEPTSDQLKETGRMFHPWWVKKRELDSIKSQINKITE